MTNFTDKDRKLIVKLARKMQLMEIELKALKRMKGKELPVASFPEEQDAPIVDTFDVVFSSDVEWSPQEKEFALKSLYQAIRGLCEDTGIVKLSLRINIPNDGI